MKKFLIILMVIFIADVGCKKENIGGGGLCGCSPIVGPYLNLAIKNSAGADLLNSQTPTAYTKENIEVFRKDANGKAIPVNFSIMPEFGYGNEKFNFKTLHVYLDAVPLQSGDFIFYLKLGGTKVYTLDLNMSMQKLLIDSKEAERDKGTVAQFTTIYYLTE
jgi:hypothetical protein